MNEIKIYSPIDNSLVGKYIAMDKSDIDKSIKKLETKFKEYRYESMTYRYDILKAAIDELEKNIDVLTDMLVKEISKSRNDSYAEIKRSIEISRYTLEEAMHMDMEAYNGQSLGSSSISVVLREPLGIVLAIAPFNYPINLSLSKIIPALMMGNVVLFKPPTQGSVVCSKMVEIMNSVLPEGLLELAVGKGSVIGDHIITHPSVKLINFTGSTGVGKSIQEKAGDKRIIMELGGKDPAIVLNDCDIEKTASEIVSGAFSYSGQRCTAIKRVLVQNDVADKLIEKIVKLTEKLTVGNPFDNSVICPLIDSKSKDFVKGLIDDAILKGAKALTGNKVVENTIYPTVIDKVSENMEIYLKEPFGPILPIIRFNDIEEAIKISNISEYGLQASIFTKDTKKAFEIAKKLEVGTVNINKKTSRGPDNFPFLGIKNSGVNTQGVKYSLLSTTNIKSIVMEI